MSQILDFFNMLAAAGGPDSETVSWQLVEVSMKSPLSATAEAVSRVPGVPPDLIAKREKTVLSSSIDDIVSNGTVPEWMGPSTLRTAHAFFERILNGIGRTDIKFDEHSVPTIIVDKRARAAIESIELAEQATAPPAVDLSRTEFGSVEGNVLSATTFYGRPALRVKERLTGTEFVCIFSEVLAQTAGVEHNWYEIWTNKRVLVVGEIKYGRDGKVARVSAIRIRGIDPPPLSPAEAWDPSFTGGVSPAEYVELSRRADGA